MCTPSAASSFPARRWRRTRKSCSSSPGIWPDIEKSRAEAKRLLKEAGAEGLSFELLNRNVDQPYKYNAHLGDRRVEQDRPSRHAARGADRPVVRGDAARQFRCRARPAIARAWSTRCSTCRGTCRARSTRRTTGNSKTSRRSTLYDKMLRETDFAEAAGADARSSRNTCSTPGARDLPAVVVPDGALPVLCQGLEDQPEPLPQPGSGDCLARQIASREQAVCLREPVKSRCAC